jgi:hypothetical protein
LTCRRRISSSCVISEDQHLEAEECEHCGAATTLWNCLFGAIFCRAPRRRPMRNTLASSLGLSTAGEPSRWHTTHGYSTMPGRVTMETKQSKASRSAGYSPASGSCRFVWRLVERNDVIVMQIALGHFSTAVLRLHFYLDRDFAPYWKWLPHEFRRRGYAPQINEQLLPCLGYLP